MNHQTAIYIIDFVNNKLKGFTLDLPIIEGVDGKYVHFNTNDLPEELEFLKYSNQMFPVHKIHKSVVNKAKKVINSCKEKFGERLNILKEDNDKINPNASFEIAINLNYEKSKNGHMYIDDITFLDSISCYYNKLELEHSLETGIMLLSSQKYNCHFHPNVVDDSHLFSSEDSLGSFLTGGEHGIINYHNKELGLWFYYTIKEQRRIISVAPKLEIDSNDNDFITLRDEIASIADNKKEIAHPKLNLINIGKHLVSLIKFPDCPTPKYKNEIYNKTNEMLAEIIEKIGIIRENKGVFEDIKKRFDDIIKDLLKQPYIKVN